MSEKQQPVISTPRSERVSLATYVIGFLFSVILTLAAFTLVNIHINHHHNYPTDSFVLIALASLAIVQFLVQLFFFLHLGKETKPRWKLLVLSFMIIVVTILVFGSLWIMQNLNYRMTPQKINTYLRNQDGGV